MEKDYLIQLTQNLYRLTLLFPKKEPLRYKMREIADDILANLISRGGPEVESMTTKIFENLEVLDGFFEVAKAQNWVRPVELLRLQEEYNRIKAEIKKLSKHLSEEGQTLQKFCKVRPRQEPYEVRPRQIINQLVKVKPSQTTLGVGINKRQQKILEFLKENGRAQVWQVKQVFPEVTKRTLRRDFEFLLKQSIIERIGERNNTFYQLPRNYLPPTNQEFGRG